MGPEPDSFPPVAVVLAQQEIIKSPILNVYYYRSYVLYSHLTDPFLSYIKVLVIVITDYVWPKSQINKDKRGNVL